MKTDTEIDRKQGTNGHRLTIRQRLHRRPFWHWGVLLLVVCGAVVAVWPGRSGQKGADKKGKGAASTPVTIATSRTGDVPVYLDGLGSVLANNTVTIHSRVDGQLLSIAIKEGQEVNTGDLLAQIDPRSFQTQRDQAAGQLAKDQALLDNAKVDLDRYRGLLEQQAIPKQQFDTQTATVKQYEGVVQTDQGALKSAELQLSYCRITSPLSGRAGLRLVDSGNIVHASDPNGIFVITQVHPIAVVFTLPEDNLPQVLQKLAAKQTLPVEAYNRDKSMLLAKGKLLTVDNEIDPNTGTSKLKAIFDNKENTLLPNQFVNVRLLVETRRNQVIVPSVAIQRGSQGNFVYVVKSDDTVDSRPVKIGVTEGNDAAISSGLNEGENVVVDGADKLQPGSKVAVEAPAGTHHDSPKGDGTSGNRHRS